MRSPTRIAVCLTFLLVAISAAAPAGAAFPWPGLAPSVVSDDGHVRFLASIRAGRTLVRMLDADGALLRFRRIDGAYGIPAVTFDNSGGGLSRNGRLLVLAEPPPAKLRETSTFRVVRTDTLRPARTISLAGEFSYDALSADARTLFLIEHEHAQDLTRYAVRAYDLRTGRLLPGVIVDPREPDEVMRGYPVSRATDAAGRWVYTLYQTEAEPFIHALDTKLRKALCIDLTGWAAGDVWTSELGLEATGTRLTVRLESGELAASMDTRTHELVG